jgi:tetratricopeptide (TPR) repeat protein
VLNGEAIRTERWHRASSPDRAEPQLLTALNNRAVLLEELDRYDEAVTSAEEAVELAKALANQELDEKVAMTHQTLGSALSKAGRHDEALAAVEAAVTAYRTLDDDALADVLRDLALVRLRRGEHPEASAAAAESVRRYEVLVDREPLRYADEQARALETVSEIQRAARR